MTSDSRTTIWASRYQPLVWLLAALSGGIVADRYLPVPAPHWWLLAAALWCGWFGLWLRRLHGLAAATLLAAVAAFGALWHHGHWNLFDPDEVGRFARDSSEPVCLEAVALSGPRRSPAPPPDPMNTLPRGESTEVALRVTDIRDGVQWREATGRLNMRIEGQLVGVRAGDRLRVFGMISRPATSRNPGEFDFPRLLRTRRQLCSLRVGHPNCVQLIRRGSWSNPRRWIYELRGRCDDLLWQYIDGRRAALASAVLLGAREQIDRERNEDFFTTGTIHLLAISGLHVGMLAYTFWFVVRAGWVARRGALWCTMAFVILYALLTEARPPVVRATILILVFCAARLLGRQALSFNTLAAAGLFVLLVNPAQLFQTGTQLSFLAVATLACCGSLLVPATVEDPLDRLIAQTRPWPIRLGKHVKGVVLRLWLTSTVIWLVALPLVLYRFHLVTPGAIVLNPVLIPPVAVALVVGFGVIVFGWLLPPVGALCGWLCDASLWIIEALIHVARPIYGSHFFMPAPALWWVLGFYAGLGALVTLPWLCSAWRWRVALVFAWTALGLFSTYRFPFASGQTNQRLTCTFVAVGHGTSVVIELPNGQTLLYDAGRLGSPHVASQAVAGYLLSRGLSRVDAVIISHADADHYNALPEILEQISVGAVFISPVTSRGTNAPLSHLRQAIQRRSIPVRYLRKGDRLITANDVQIVVLHPPTKGVPGSDNANSIVLKIDYGGQRILLPGDLEPPGLQSLLAQQPQDCDLIMAPHHGSMHSNPQGFAAWSTPEWVVISGGQQQDATAVTQAFQAAGANVLHTAQIGAVQATIDRQTLAVRTWRQHPWR